VNKPERGDTVCHIPTGEEWLLIRVEGDYVYPGGWPISRALKADCVVVKKADAEAIAFLDKHAPQGAGR
jgi:hypothetical protein